MPSTWSHLPQLCHLPTCFLRMAMTSLFLLPSWHGLPKGAFCTLHAAAGSPSPSREHMFYETCRQVALSHIFAGSHFI